MNIPDVDTALKDMTKVARLLPPAETILFRLAGIQTLAHEPHKSLSTLRRLDKTPEVIAARDLATLIIQAEDSLGEGACYNPEFAVVAISVAEMKIRVPLPREWTLIRVRAKFETDDLKGAEEALDKVSPEKVDAEILLWKGKARLFRDHYLAAAEIFQVIHAGERRSKFRKQQIRTRIAKKRSPIWNWQWPSRPNVLPKCPVSDSVTPTKPSGYSAKHFKQISLIRPQKQSTFVTERLV